MLVMHKSVSLKYALEGRSTRTEEVPSVHQLPVYLGLDKGHQNARENEPATTTSQYVNGSHFRRPLPIVPRRSPGWSLRPSRSESPLPERNPLVIASTP